MNQDDTADEREAAPSPGASSEDAGPDRAVPASEVEELRERLLRALADADNARKRGDRARAEGRETGISDLASMLVPALGVALLEEWVLEQALALSSLAGGADADELDVVTLRGKGPTQVKGVKVKRLGLGKGLDQDLRAASCH